MAIQVRGEGTSVIVASSNDGLDEDAWGAVLFSASFGGLPLYVLNTSDVGGNRLVRHSFPHRDGEELEPMGAVARKTRCKLIFFYPLQSGLRLGPQDSFLDPTAYFRAFMDLVASPERQVFTHPLTGSYMARVGEVTYAADPSQRDVITAECTFEEDTLEPAVFDQAAAFTSATSMIDVTQSRAALQDEILVIRPKVGTTIYVDALETAADDSVDRASTWGDPVKKLRDANLELAQSLEELDIANQNLGASLDVGFFPLITAVNDLKLSLIQRWRSTQQAARIIQVTVYSPAPLFVLAAQIYGATGVEDRVNQILGLNDVRNPLRIEAGTVLNVQSPTVPVNGAPSRRAS